MILWITLFGLLVSGCAGGIIDIDRLKETNQDVYGCVQLDVAARGGRVNLLLMPKGVPLPPDVKMPVC